MAGPNYGLSKGFVAGGVITQFRAVTLGAGEVVSQATTAGTPCLGIAQETTTAEDATNGRVIAVAISGISRCIAGAAITIGAKVRTDTSGRVTPLAAATADQNVIGIALQAASAANEHVDVLLTPAVQNTTP